MYGRGGLDYRTRTSRSSSEGLVCPMAARQFLCSVSLCLAWLPSGVSCVAKGEIMKALPKNLLPLTLIGIAVTSLFSVQPAQAFTITLEQMGANVVANGSGAVNLTGLTFVETSVGAGVG